MVLALREAYGMVRVVFVFVVLLCVSAFAFTQSPPTAAIPWANKFFAPENTPAQIVHDFGTVPSGTLLQHTFKITNIYDVPMQVVYVRKSCSCLEAFAPTNAIPANETAEFKITMDTSKFKGANAQTFNVTFGPSFVSTATIQVKAVSRADVQLNPGTVSFGTVSQGSSPTQSVNIKYTGRQKDWKITGAAESNGPFEVVIEEGRWFNSEFKASIKLKSDAAPGQLSGTVQLKTNDTTSPIITIPVSANIQAPITISPAKASFGKIELGQSTTIRIMVRSAKPFKIESFHDDKIGISADVALAAAAPVQVVNVKFTPKQLGSIKAELKLKTDVAGTLLTIPIEAEVTK
jgi:hypothetical protein